MIVYVCVCGVVVPCGVSSMGVLRYGSRVFCVSGDSVFFLSVTKTEWLSLLGMNPSDVQVDAAR